MYTNAKIRIHPAVIYLIKVSNENSRTRCVICPKLTKKDNGTTSHRYRSEYLLLTFKRSHAFSKYLIFEFREVLPVGFASSDQSTDR